MKSVDWVLRATGTGDFVPGISGIAEPVVFLPDTELAERHGWLRGLESHQCSRTYEARRGLPSPPSAVPSTLGGRADLIRRPVQVVSVYRSPGERLVFLHPSSGGCPGGPAHPLGRPESRCRWPWKPPRRLRGSGGPLRGTQRRSCAGRRRWGAGSARPRTDTGTRSGKGAGSRPPRPGPQGDVGAVGERPLPAIRPCRHSQITPLQPRALGRDEKAEFLEFPPREDPELEFVREIRIPAFPAFLVMPERTLHFRPFENQATQERAHDIQIFLAVHNSLLHPSIPAKEADTASFSIFGGVYSSTEICTRGISMA